MKKMFFVIPFLAMLIGLTCCKIYNQAKGKTAAEEVVSKSKPIDHKMWSELLEKYVDDNGMVNYRGFQKDSVKLRAYLKIIEKGHPNDENWSQAEQMAFWINAYNAFTVELIVRNYPLKSIKEIGGKIPFVNSTWDIKFIRIEGVEYDLNAIEHSILRPKFDDPRIHFAVNCASMSCPKLFNEAFEADKLEAQLEMAAQSFLNDGVRNKITNEKAQVSMLFKWFKDDFEKTAPTVRAFINRYSKTQIGDNKELEFLDYDWSLNEQKN